MRLNQMLEQRSNNDKLQKYLEEKSKDKNYDSASFGETSGDERSSLKVLSSESSGDLSVKIFRESPVTLRMNQAMAAAHQI